MIPMYFFGARSNRAISLVISADQAVSYNVFTASGSPSDPVDVTLTISATIKVSQMRALGFPLNSRIFLINNGFIYGGGGSGGGGGGIPAPTGFTAGAIGTNGTDALQSNCRLIITNASGAIYGGGGGGRGGGCGSSTSNGSANGCGGGGGGGGQGYPGGFGGTGGNGFSANGITGQVGILSGAGIGTGGGTFGGAAGAWGGDGGAWAQAGNASGVSPASPFAPAGANGGTNSNGGRAIFSNGAGVFWISGAANVAGSVS